MSAPVDTIMKQTVKDLKQYGCDVLVRTCEKTYNEDMILDEEIKIIDLEFPDGSSPPKQVVNRFLKLVREKFGTKAGSGGKGRNHNNFEDSKLVNESGVNAYSFGSGMKKEKQGRIGIHCLAGLGRAPVLVALALIHFGSSPENAISLIRKQRPGAINHAQAHFILNYKKSGTSCNIF